MITIQEVGDWAPGQVTATAVASTRVRIADVERGIERAWAEASARLGAKLFDGPMCRLERCEGSPEALRLWVSPTSYKPFLGTNLMARDVPPEARANPVGLSAALVTRDGWLMLGQRNASVAYYPDRIHPFAGSLEPGEIADVFAGMRRELREELRLGDGEVGDLRCLGLIEDATLRQPELIFAARATRSRSEIEAALDGAEHHACIPVETTPARVEAMMSETRLTPVAVGTLALWGRVAFGEDWFRGMRSRIELR